MNPLRRSTSDASEAPYFKHTKRLPKAALQMFRIRDLPLELRRMIYRLCMVNETPIFIEEDVPSDFDGNPLTQAKTFDNDELERLTLNRFTARTLTSIQTYFWSTALFLAKPAPCFKNSISSDS